MEDRKKSGDPGRAAVSYRESVGSVKLKSKNETIKKVLTTKYSILYSILRTEYPDSFWRQLRAIRCKLPPKDGTLPPKDGTFLRGEAFRFYRGRLVVREVRGIDEHAGREVQLPDN